MTINYSKYDDDFMNKYHEKLHYYRKLYEGKHSEIFDRAKELIQDGEIVDNLLKENGNAMNPKVAFVQTPYIVANICKLIPEVPAMLVARSIGKIDTSLENDEGQNDEILPETSSEIDGPNDDTFNGTVTNTQSELIATIVKNSNLHFEHYPNIVQQQVDGGLVGVPWKDARGVRIEFKARDVYFPHDDGLGADLTFVKTDLTDTDEEYLYTYRERQEEKGLLTSHTLRVLVEGKKTMEELPPAETAELLNMKVNKLKQFYTGKIGTFIKYWANEKTFMQPLGVSVLRNQEGRQDEINWRLTRTAAIFERNGKPRLAVSKEILRKLQEKMVKQYGQGAEHSFDSRDLEIVSMDENGKSIEVIQIDVANIGDISWIKDLIKMMLIETKTSEKAIDFYMSENGGTATSGIAKFYDLFMSLMKAEHIQKEYIHFLKELISDALWLVHQTDKNVKIEEPTIYLLGMIPVQRKEIVDEAMAAYSGANGKSAQSLETTVRKINPDKSEDWIQDELTRIELESQSDNSTTLDTGSRQTLENLLDNPSSRVSNPPTRVAVVDEGDET